ncbi:uracil-DNA glycosylase [Paenibacillus sp. Y412MC10]|uniref:uracil-DNA glycosylase n=1 Tax=Geobacillus sp. (strain Y412MC10) TaxID=481743 RepID=UPI0016426943|nr:uracil-DNA glycosylase [Paenibacillus sp. Y412MC10]
MGGNKVIKAIPTVERRMVRGEGYSEDGDAWLHPEVEEEAAFDQKARKIVDKIAAKLDFQNVSNFYADSEMKHRNLLHYFNMLFWHKPEHMFIGEAPGKDGCVRTGIPFTSERLIRRGQFKKHMPHVRFVVEGNQTERSATVIWKSIETLANPSLMWNVFPLHPCDEIGKNRTPRREELEWGKTVLPLVVDLFPGIKVVSVGEKARSACRELGIVTIGHLNHPRRADIFRKQFESLFPKG